MGLETPLPAEIGPKVGLLCDRDIKQALEAGFLFEGKTFDLEKAKYASYEIRIGPAYEVLRFQMDDVAHVPKNVSSDGAIEIPPGATFLIIAEEQFRIPTDVFAKITTVGQIFSSGLAAENTFADPGYTGPLYITVSNISNRTLTVRRGDPLARVEFHRFLNKPERTHQGFTGRRKTFVRSKVDPQIVQLLRDKSTKELLEEMISKSLDEAMHSRFARSEVLIEKAHGEIESLRIAQAALRRFRYLSAILVFVVVFSLIRQFDLLGFLQLPKSWDFFWSVVASILASAIWYFFEKRFISKT